MSEYLQKSYDRAVRDLCNAEARIAKLEAAIRKHKDTVWGSMKVRDPTARELYAALLGGGE